jgi:hypothetical protein
MFVNHIGPKILIWGGADMTPNRLEYISNLQQQQTIYCWVYPGEFSNILTNYNIKHKQLHVALKSYIDFTPIILGENIYVYKGLHGNRPSHYHWNNVVNPLIEVFGKDRITFTDHLPITELIEKFYKNCFVYVKPNPVGGCTTMFELGHMGMRTLGIGHKNLEFFSEYSDIYHLIDLVVDESKYIGKTRKDIAESAKNIFAGSEWLTLNFWNE